MENLLRINGVIEESIVDGFGIRYVIFTQGCQHECPHCHNPGTHEVNGGYNVDIKDLYHQITENPLLKGVTFSGGEPFLQPKPLVNLAKMLKKNGLDITTYSGYTYDALIHEADPDRIRLLKITNILIDGPFIYEKRNLSLLFRGSDNQRILFLEDGNAGELAQVVGA